MLGGCLALSGARRPPFDLIYVFPASLVLDWTWKADVAGMSWCPAARWAAVPTTLENSFWSSVGGEFFSSQVGDVFLY